MFKYFINEPTIISITTGLKRIIFPLHKGLIGINTNDDKFNFSYFSHYSYTNLYEKVCINKLNTVHTVQLYKIQDRYIVDIPRVYFRNVKININKVDNKYNECLLSVLWLDNDIIKSIEIIPSSEISKYIK